MSVRENSRDGSRFLGCDDFPNCRGTRDLGGGGTARRSQSGRRGSRPDWVGRSTIGSVPKCTSSLPAALSPSNAVTFMRCPRQFYEEAISKRIEFLGTPATTKGKIAHEVFEKIFDLPPSGRTARSAVNLVRPSWTAMSVDPEAAPVAALPARKIEAMLTDTEEAVRNWFTLEDPSSFEPVDRELRVKATLKDAPMRGIIDRVDDLGGGRVAIVDYKTGKQPRREFKDEALLPIRIYAAAMSTKPGVTVDEVRLIYVSPKHQGEIREPVTKASIADTKNKFSEIWRDIKAAAKQGQFESRTSPLCDYCDAKPICPAWT